MTARIPVIVLWLLVILAGCAGGTPAATPTRPAATPLPPTVEPTLAPTVAPTEEPAVEPTAQPTAEPTSGPATEFAPAAGRIVFYSDRDGNPEIYTMNPDGGDPRRLTFDEGEDSSPVWSPDGRQIAFVSDRDDPESGRCFPDCHYQIYLMDADGENQRRLVETEFAALHPAWRPDGGALTFDSASDLGGDVYLASADGSGLQILIADGFWADWSPDGTRIAFGSGRDGNMEIYAAAADGSDVTRLTDDGALDYFPAWSPDGTRIAYGRVAGKQILVMNADGGDPRELLSQGSGEDPAWSPDGREIVFQSSRDGDFEIYALDVAATLAAGEESGLRQLTENRAEEFWPCWTAAAGEAATAPAGAQLALVKGEQAFPDVPTWKIGLADLDADGDLDAVFANGMSNVSQLWLNDGAGFFTDSGQELGYYGHGVDVGDVDGDGDPDVVISTHRDTSPTRVYLNDGQAHLTELEGAFDANIGFRIELYDLDGDNDLDAVGETIQETRVFVNDGTGRFARGELALPLTAAWGDLDGDGDVDVLVKTDGAGYSVLLNDGAGNFSPYWELAAEEAMSIGDMTLGDLDGDGDPDVVASNGHWRLSGHPVRVLLNDGSGRFVDSGQGLSAVLNAGVSLGDLDGDGDLDLALGDYLEPCQIWLNDGAGTFTDSGLRLGGGQFYPHLHLVDLDGDGDLDVFLATFGTSEGPNEIWFSQRN